MNNKPIYGEIRKNKKGWTFINAYGTNTEYSGMYLSSVLNEVHKFGYEPISNFDEKSEVIYLAVKSLL